MRFSFCKKSVFCALFFVFFLLGTICGMFLLRCLVLERQMWLFDYCSVLRRTSNTNLVSLLWFQVIPLLGAVAVYFLPYKDRLFPILFFIRGCLLSYSCGAFCTSGIPFWDTVLLNALLLPAFYGLCRWLWCKDPC